MIQTGKSLDKRFTLKSGQVLHLELPNHTLTSCGPLTDKEKKEILQIITVFYVSLMEDA